MAIVPSGGRQPSDHRPAKFEESGQQQAEPGNTVDECCHK